MTIQIVIFLNDIISFKLILFYSFSYFRLVLVYYIQTTELMELEALPADIWISIIVFLSYYDLINLKSVSKKMTNILSTKLVLKYWLNEYHPMYFYDDYTFENVKNCVETRWLHAKKIINLLYSIENVLRFGIYENFPIKIFGGFIRDYEARTREFSDIDIWLNDETNVNKIVRELEKKNYNVLFISKNINKMIKYADGYAKHSKLQVTHKTLSNPIILDITSNCMFEQIARDYDVNSLYIHSPGFLNVDFVKKDSPIKNSFGRTVRYGLRGEYCKCEKEEKLISCRCGIQYIITMARKKLFNSAKCQLFNKKEDIETRHKKMLNMGFVFNYGKKFGHNYDE